MDCFQKGVGMVLQGTECVLGLRSHFLSECNSNFVWFCPPAGTLPRVETPCTHPAAVFAMLGMLWSLSRVRGDSDFQ